MSNVGSISPLPFAANLLRYERQDLTSLWRSAANGIPTCHILESELE